MLLRRAAARILRHTMAHLFGEIAVDLGLVKPDQLKTALDKQQSLGASHVKKRMGEVLMLMNVLDAEKVKDVLREQRRRREDDAKNVTVKTIGRYRIVEKLGEGGLGSVYKGTDPLTGQTVALKVLLKQFSGNTTFGQRFSREASVAASLRHENIVSCLDFGAEKGMQYLVMEYVEGQTLRSKLDESGPFSEKDALAAIKAMAQALNVAHAKGIVHRDIRPENVIVSKAGVLKLADFGTAKSFLEDESLSRTGVVLGTPHFMSPEQVRSEKDIDPRADLYSLGVSLYLLLTGKVPFDAPRKLDIMQMHLQATPAPLAQSAPNVSAGTAAIVQKLLAKDRASRYPSAQSLIADIDRVLAGESPTLPSGALATDTKDEPAPAKKSGCAAKVAIIAVAVAIGWSIAREMQ